MSHLTVIMSHAPHTIGAKQPLSMAHHLMREHGIRHLPVLDMGQLVGIVSQRDLHFLETFRDVDPTLVSVDEAMTAETYAVTPRTTLHRAAAAMAERKIGSAVVIEEGRVVGMFTTVDALLALVELTGGGKQ
jgi:acetoin utilization protein AcuB